MRGTRWSKSAKVVGLLTGVAGLVASPVAAQSIEGGRAGPRSILDRDVEVALALSAAPAEVSANANVFVWNGNGFEVGRAGNSGVSCYVARSWPESLEPHCFDPEGSRTIMSIHMRQMQLWHEGLTPEAVDEEIAEGLRSGEFQLPSRPAMSYMMSAGQHLISETGEVAGSWEPHLMIYYPWLTESDLGLGMAPSMDAAVVVDPGTPFSNIMIVVQDHVPVSAASRGSR